MKTYQNSTLTHKQHKEIEMKKEHEKVTKETIAEDTAKLQELQAEYNGGKATDERKAELQPQLRDLDKKIKYDQDWLDNGCKIAKNGDRLLHGNMKRDNFEISVK